MSIFEFAFSLFGLLLGLSLAELLGGFARYVEARRSARLGWLTPLLAVLMLLDIVSFWASAWYFRDSIDFSFPSLLAVTVFAGAYYVGAYLVFPREIAGHADLDEHYLAIRRPVLGIILVANLIQFAVFLWLRGWDSIGLGLSASFAVFDVLLVANMFVRGARWTPAILALSIAVYLANLLG